MVFIVLEEGRDFFPKINFHAIKNVFMIQFYETWQKHECNRTKHVYQKSENFIQSDQESGAQ